MGMVPQSLEQTGHVGLVAWAIRLFTFSGCSTASKPKIRQDRGQAGHSSGRTEVRQDTAQARTRLSSDQDTEERE